MHLPITIGTRPEAEPGTPAVLDASRFNRHTFWCGQSGSGKTYALGLVLERLLLDTGLPMLVLDPNADFVNLGVARDDASDADREAIENLDIRVFRPRSQGTENPLIVRYVDMDVASRAAALRLDPIRDADEFHVFRELENEFGPQDGDAMVAALKASPLPERQRLLRRIENLGVLNWDTWARGAAGVESVVESRPDATVLDLGGFPHQDEASTVALAVLDRLWAQRETRKPLLIVIDEAHNLCPPEPTGPLQAAVVQRLIQIAAEGRKYGLWLLLSTQRPSKVHPQVLSQCDNLCVMKMNSPADLDHLAQYFGAVPRPLFDLVPSFTQGRSLFAGGFSPEPSIVQLGDRITVEGGSDVGVPGTRVARA